MTRKLVLLLLIALGWCRLTGQNGAPQGFNYQSVVRDANDNPLANQTVTLLMTIRSGAPNGPVAYSEKHVTSTNDYGLVNLIVGQGGTPLQGTFTSVNWAGGPKYLTVSIETSPNVFDELGSSQLMSVPYALYAQAAGSGTGTGTGDNWGSQVVQTGPSLQGNGTAASPIALAQNGAQGGQVLKWNGSAWLPSDDVTGGNSGTITQINTGAGLTGGPITSSGTIGLAPTGVTAGIYGSASQIPVFSVDAQGRVTNAFTVIASPGDQTVITAGAGINVAQNGPAFTISNTGDTNPNDDLTATTAADGDVSGVFSNLQIKAGAVGTAEIASNAVTSTKIADDAVTNAKLADNAVGAAELQSSAVTAAKLATAAVTTAKVADGAITAAKLDDMGAANGQVLKWNGSIWAPAADISGGSSLNLTPGAGINIIGTAPNLTILNTGDLNPDDDLTASATFNGDVTGPFNNLQLKTGVVGAPELAADAVTTAKIADDAVTGAKIAPMSATSGQVLKWNGTTWAPATDVAGTVTLTNGPGISVSGGNGNYTIGNTGDADENDDVLKTTQHDGDVSGVYNNLQIKPGVVGTPEIAPAAITAVKLAQMGATSGQVLKWNGTTWAPANDNTGGAGTGDDWGNQVVQTTASLAGNGTSASPLTIAPQGAAAGQVLKWNGAAWLPGNDLTGGAGGSVSIAGGPGISVSGTANDFLITNTGDTDATNDLTTATAFNGDVAGPYDNLQIKTGVVGSTEITDGDVKTADLANQSVTGNKLDDMGASLGQVLKWNGTTWTPGTDLTGGGGGSISIAAGAGIDVTVSPSGTDFLIANTGDADATDDLTDATAFDGDVSGPYNDLQLKANVVTATEIAANAVNTAEIANGAVTAAKIDDMNATAGQVLKWNGTTWGPAADQAGTLNLTAGTGISITGTAPNLTIANTGDADEDPANELQTLSLNGTELSLSVNNSTVDFGPVLTAAGLNLWKTNGDHLYNTNTGNVGINMTNPAFRLDVNGDAHIKSAAATPQLILENGGNDYARLLMKNAGGSGTGWVLEGRDAGVASEFHIDLKAASNARFITLRGDRNVVIGEQGGAGMGLVLNHKDRGFVLSNVDNPDDSWEFWVSDNAVANSLQLEHNGSVVGTFTTAGLYVPSDRRLKKDIHALPPVLARLRNLDAYAYRYIRQDDDRESIGFMAQDLQVAFPELVSPMPARHDQPGYLSVNYGGLSVVAIKAIQEQQQQIDTLRQTNEQLQQRIESLEARLSRLEKQ